MLLNESFHRIEMNAETILVVEHFIFGRAKEVYQQKLSNNENVRRFSIGQFGKFTFIPLQSGKNSKSKHESVFCLLFTLKICIQKTLYTVYICN